MTSPSAVVGYWPGSCVRASDDDVAVAGAGEYLDGPVVLVRARGVLQEVADGAVLGGGVHPGGGPLAHPDVDRAVRALEPDPPARGLLDPDAAVRAPCRGVAEGPIYRDRPVGAGHAKAARGLADLGAAVRVLDDGVAVELACTHAAGRDHDLGGAGGVPDDDGTGRGAELDPGGLVDPDVPGGAGERAGAEAPLCEQGAEGASLQGGSGRQPDR